MSSRAGHKRETLPRMEGRGALKPNFVCGLFLDARRLHGVRIAADAQGLKPPVVPGIAGALDEHAPLVLGAVERVAVHVAADAWNPARGGELPEGPAAVVVALVGFGRGAADPEGMIGELAFQDLLMEGDVGV